MRRRLKVRLGRWEGVHERLGERMVMAERGLSMPTSTCMSEFMSMSMSMSSVPKSPAVVILSGDELPKGESWSSDRLRLRSIAADLRDWGGFGGGRDQPVVQRLAHKRNGKRDGSIV